MANEPIRRFFDDVQMAAESGGRQFDKDGKPLVGRYRDGRTPSKDKQAFGAGQMQVGTAREAAQRAGIQWDERRFFNDREYNLNLADSHMKHLLTRYGGDRTLARAAYHSGPGTVDSALRQHGRANFANGLGPEGRKYIQMGSGASDSQGRPVGVGDPNRFLEGLESSLGPEAKASANVTQNSSKIFNSDEELNRRGAQVEGDIVRERQQLDVLGQVQEVAQQTTTAALTQSVEQSKAIGSEIVAATQQLKQKTAPVFQARQRIADQLDKINTMNPLERGLRGIFDLNYDDDYLEGQLDKFDRTLQARANDFDFVNKLHATARQEIEQRFTADTALPNLAVAQAGEDTKLLTMQLSNSVQMLDSLKDGIATESQMIAAKDAARSDLMVRLDLPTIRDLLTQAESNGGAVEFNGVEFSGRELRTHVENMEQRDLQSEAYRTAIASGRMDYAEGYALNVAKSLSQKELEAAVANGNVHDGIQLDPTAVARLYETSLAAAETRAQAITNRIPGNQALGIAMQDMQQLGGGVTRAVNLLGMSEGTTFGPLMQQSAADVEAIAAAKRAGESPEVIRSLTEKALSNNAKAREVLQQRILHSVGGDETAAKYVNSFVSGVPMSQGAATEAMAYFAVTGNMPQGVAQSPETRQVFAKAREIATTVRDEMSRGGKKVKRADLVAEVNARLGDVATAAIGQARHDEIYSSLPQIAAELNHPFKGLNPQRWQEIRARARLASSDSIAIAAETTPENVDLMLRTRRPLSNSQEHKVLFDRVVAATGQANGVELQTMVKGVDAEPRIDPTRPNSSVLAEFLESAPFLNGIPRDAAARGQNSLAEYLVNPLAQGSTEQRVGRTAEELRAAQAAVYSERRQAAQNPASNMFFMPLTRTSMILESIPDVGKEGSQALAPFVREFYDSHLKEGGFDNLFFTSPNTRFREEDAALFAALQSTQFENPKQEFYRKRVVAQWNDHATAQAGFIDRFLGAISADVGPPDGTKLEANARGLR